MKTLFDTVLVKRLFASAIFAVAPAVALAQITNTPEIATKIIGMGPDLSPQMVGGTTKLYAPLHAKGDLTGVRLTSDQRYGSHERQLLDVYAPRDANGSQPILVFAHGGGFVRGDKKSVANIGRYFAKNDVVAIPVNYRFAPASKWPSGAEDMALAIKWIRANARVHGGNPAKIIVAGHSAGSMHAADYLFREELQVKDDGVIAGILISPPTVDLKGRKIDPRRDALYYGTDGDRTMQSVVNALDGRKLPVMIAYAEHEPAVISDQTHRLINAIARRDKRLPLVVSAAGHNHISIVAHIGTVDETLGPSLLSFIRLNALVAK
jgi:acetyl esterase